MAKTRKERKETIIFTVSKEEKEIIIENARKADKSVSDYCRRKLTTDNRQNAGE